MTSDSCCIFGDQLFSRPLFVSTFACPSSLSSHPRNRLDEGGEKKLCVCVRVCGVCDRVACHLIVTELGGPIKSSAGRAAPQTFFHPTLRSGAPPHTDIFARHGAAHLPRAALLSGAVPVRPEGRLQIH